MQLLLLPKILAMKLETAGSTGLLALSVRLSARNSENTDIYAIKNCIDGTVIIIIAKGQNCQSKTADNRTMKRIEETKGSNHRDFGKVTIRFHPNEIRLPIFI